LRVDEQERALYRRFGVAAPPVKLAHPMTTATTFTAPAVGPGGAELVFRLLVTDRGGLKSQDKCTIHVY
jgi:hypothetical protein